MLNALGNVQKAEVSDLGHKPINFPGQKVSRPTRTYDTFCRYL